MYITPRKFVSSHSRAWKTEKLTKKLSNNKAMITSATWKQNTDMLDYIRTYELPTKVSQAPKDVGGDFIALLRKCIVINHYST